MQEPGPFDDYIRAALAVYRRPHAMELAATVRPGFVGCMTCGHVGEAAEFRRKPGRALRFGDIVVLPHRLCPRCHADVDSEGRVEPDELAAHRNRQA